MQSSLPVHYSDECKYFNCNSSKRSLLGNNIFLIIIIEEKVLKFCIKICTFILWSKFGSSFCRHPLIWPPPPFVFLPNPPLLTRQIFLRILSQWNVIKMKRKNNNKKTDEGKLILYVWKTTTQYSYSCTMYINWLRFYLK